MYAIHTFIKGSKRGVVDGGGGDSKEEGDNLNIICIIITTPLIQNYL